VLVWFASLLPAVARADGDPDVRFPVGPFVRAGRPLVVRVAGAVRVRAAGSPWALPQGTHGDEFVLNAPRGDVTFHEFEVDTGAGVRRVAAALRVLPSDRTVTAVLAGTSASTGAAGGGAVVVATDDLPTVREGWLLFDDVGEPPAGLPAPARRALDAWRSGPRAGSRAGFEPLLHEPAALPFRATAESAAASGTLPDDVRRVLLITALVELVLVGLLRSAPAGRRAAWLALPPLVCGAWMLLADRLPGAVRATVATWDDAAAGDRLVVLRLDARRDADVSFRVPEAASTPALLRFDAEDRTAEEAEVGREVRLRIPAGQARVVAWRTRSEPPAEAGAGAPARSAGDAWRASLGIGPAAVRVGATPDSEVVSARGFVPVPADALVVSTRK
jgi:hypothetical protein